MKKYFFTGFITLLPIGITVIIVIWLFDLFTAPFTDLFKSFIVSHESELHLGPGNHDTLISFLSRICAFVFLMTLIFLLGFAGRRFFFKFLLNLTDAVFSRIPLVRTIYRLCHDVTKATFSDTKKTFKETVLVPFPHLESHAIGFVTGDVPRGFHEKTGAEIAIFVPTSPHPMSGYILLSPKKLSVSVDVSIEEAFKFIISCGVIHPGEAPPANPQVNSKV